MNTDKEAVTGARTVAHEYNRASVAEIRKLVSDLEYWLGRGEKRHALAVCNAIGLEIQHLLEEVTI